METAVFMCCVIEAAMAMPAHQQELCELDLHIGDGDHGVTIARGYTAVLEDDAVTRAADLQALFLSMSEAMMNSMGGAIGPIYGLFFEALSNAHQGGRPVSAASLAEGFEGAVNKIGAICNVSIGQKTVYDAMVPAAQVLSVATEKPLQQALEGAVQAAREGRDATIPMMAQKGRARFARERSIGFVDAGAFSFVLWLEALLQAVVEEEKQ